MLVIGRDKLMRILAHILTFVALWTCRALSFGPRPVLRGVAKLTAGLAFRFADHRRSIALTNLQICFPEWTQKQRLDCAKRHFYFYIRAFLERFEIWFGSPKRLRQRVRIVGIDYFKVHEGRPVIILAPHFLGLDAGGVRFQLEHQFASLYAHQSNPLLDAWTLKGRTRFNGSVILSRQQGMTVLARWLKRGVPIYFLPDMDLGLRDSVFVPFFGVPAATVTSVVRLSRLFGAVVVPLITRLTEDGYEARFYPGWTHPDDDAQETVHEGVARMNRFIEERILEAPEQYLWTHRRFKTRPEGTPSVYG